jgi:phenylacetate-CoA ligase
MGLNESIYARLPAPLQSAAITVRGAQLARERYGAVYRRTLRELPGIFALPRAELEALQLRALRELVAYAARHSPYYREVLAGIDPASLRTLDDLRRLPVLEKETLRARAPEIYTLPLGDAIEGHTGGTTGTSIVVAYTRDDFQRRMAELDYFRGVHGARHRMRRATFNGKHVVGREGRGDVFWRTNHVLRQRFYSTFHLSRANLPRYVEDLERFRPQIIDGFPSCILDVADEVVRRGRPLSFRPVAIFPTAEPLYPHLRERLREVFGVEPRDQYASSEGAPLVTECPRGRLHALLHTGVFETDEAGDSLVTSFTTHGTPLIRYRIGDRIHVDPEQRCDCGWEMPVVRQIEGRAIDYLYTPERGRVYSPNLSNVVKNLPNAVVRAQFVQHAPHRVEVKLEVDAARFEPGRHTAIVVQEVRDRLGEAVQVDVRVVPEIERAGSGKFRMVLNLCGDAPAAAGAGEGAATG